MTPSGNAGPGPRPVEGEERLPCGRTLDEVWEARNADRGTGGPHGADCPYCTAALRSLRTLDGLVRGGHSAEESERPADAWRGPPPGNGTPGAAPDEDARSVEAAATRTFRAAADGVLGARVESCRILPAPGRAAVRVRVEVAADLSRGFPDLAEEVRERITAAAREEAVGLEVSAVDVAVVDLLANDGGGHEPVGHEEAAARPAAPDGT